MRPAGVLWGPPLLLAVLAAALLPGASAQTFGRTSQVITVPTVAYISCEWMPCCCLAVLSDQSLLGKCPILLQRTRRCFVLRPLNPAKPPRF